MPTITAITVPADSLLARFERDGGFADAYATTVPGSVTLAGFIAAFYASPLFRVERVLLRLFAGLGSSADDLRQLADGRAQRFAAWTVAQREPHQILLAAGRTRSWLSVQPGPDVGPPCTRLCFGSAVLARRDGRMGGGFSALLGFHRVYSRLLLAAAARRLSTQHMPGKVRG